MLERMHVSRVALLFGLSALFAPRSADAQACACSCPSAGASPFSIASSSARVPRNAHVLARVDPARLDTVRLSRGGVDVEAEVTPLDGLVGWSSITAAGGFEPGGEYDLEVTLADGRGTPSVHLTVTDEVDTNAPDASRIRVLNYFAERTLCYDLVGGELGWDSGAFAYDDHVAIELEIFRGDASIGHLVLSPQSRRFGRPLDDAAPIASCFEGHIVEGLREGEDLTAHVRVHDIAGNTSDYVIDFQPYLDAPIPPGTACPYCSIAPGRRGRGSVVGVLLALAGFATWRRATARRPREP